MRENLITLTTKFLNIAPSGRNAHSSRKYFIDLSFRGKEGRAVFQPEKERSINTAHAHPRASVLMVMTTSEVRQYSPLLAQQSPVKVTCFFEAAHLHIYYFIVYVSHSASPDDNICLQKPKIRFH